MEDLFPQKLTLKESTEFQDKLAAKLILEDDFNENIEKIGAAIMHTRGDFITISAALFKTDNDLKKFELVDKNVVREKALFAAVPGFESFRDGEILTRILRGLTKPDLWFIEGHGVNHPHKLGLVSHVGLALDTPTIAVSRDFIAGRIETVNGKDAIVENGEIRGAVMKSGMMKVYVSPGHRVSWQTALDFAKKTTKAIYPEPLKIAQQNMVETINAVLKS